MPNIKAAIAPLNLGEQWPDQSQSLLDTLASYTRDIAWVEFNENNLGMLKPGMAADIAVMNCDLTQLSPEEISKACAITTIMDGIVTFEREN